MIYFSRLTDGKTTSFLVAEDSQMYGVINERIVNELNFVTPNGKPSRVADPCTTVMKGGKVSVVPYHMRDYELPVRGGSTWTWTLTKLAKHASKCGLYVYKVVRDGSDWLAVGTPGRGGSVVGVQPFKLNFPLAHLFTHLNEGWVIAGDVQGTATVLNFMEVK